MENIDKFKNNYKQLGTMLLRNNDQQNPLSPEDMNELSICCEKVEKEFIQIGDAGEKNNLLVGRFMTDIDKPRVVDNPYSEKVIRILKKEKLKKFISKVLNISENFYLRRIQFNQIDKNCFVGYHLDTDSNPDYIAAGVIQLGSDFDGGLYRVYQKNGKFYDYKSSYGDLILSDCTYPHEVTKVNEGHRKSLVFFVSLNEKENRRNR